MWEGDRGKQAIEIQCGNEISSRFRGSQFSIFPWNLSKSTRHWQGIDEKSVVKVFLPPRESSLSQVFEFLVSRFAHPSNVQSQKRYSYCSTALFIPSFGTRSRCRGEGGRLVSSRAQTVRNESLRNQNRLPNELSLLHLPSFHWSTRHNPTSSFHKIPCNSENVCWHIQNNFERSLRIGL